MSFRSTSLAVFLLVPGLVLGAGLALATRSAERADPAITRSDIEACVTALASDEMQGRATGTPECERAGEWLGAALKRAGVAAAGDDGTYFQKVPFARIEYGSIPKLTAWSRSKPRELASGVDFTFLGGVPAKKQRLRVVVVKGADDLPKKPDAGLALFLDGKSRERGEWLGEGGGAGFGLIVSPGADGPGKKADSAPPRSRDIVGSMQRDTTAKLQANGELLAGLRDGSIEALELDCDATLRELPAFNVIGRIAGVGTPERPELAQQAIVFSAHYDHIGVDTRKTAGEGVDLIRNGADDDASGCAAVLELAEAFAAGPPPARTLIFFFATGEEIGLVGTHHYINHPLVPLDRTVLNLNFEMIGRPDELVGGAGKLWLTGFERSNLGAEFQSLGLGIVSDGRPEQNFFKRSDNYAFAVKGVVAQTLSSYNLHRDYHQVSDEPGTLDYEHMETCVRAAFEGSKALAEGRIDPVWLEGQNPKR
jgi:hypothetical protein